MDAFEVVRQLKARRNAILLEHLPSHLLREVDEIEAAIRQIDDVLLKQGVGADAAIPPPLSHLIDEKLAAVQKTTRVPLAQRRETLRTYLTARGPATRAQIVTDTGIPAGTLSALLSDSEFESIGYGLWRLTPPQLPGTTEGHQAGE